MHVLIDCRFANVPTGLGRYTRELTRALLQRKDDGIEYSLLLRPGKRDWLEGVTTKMIVADIPHYSFAEHLKLPGLIRQSGANLFFSLHFNVPWRCPVPFIATIHDLILHRFPNDAPFLKRAAYRILMHRTVRRARTLITVSDFTSEELARAYGSDVLKKTERVYEGVTELFVPASSQKQETIRKKFSLSFPYFLYIGNAKQHKNVQFLIDAFHEADLKDPELVLVTGGPEAERLRLGKNVRIVRDIADADLPALYSAGLACVTASSYEGFCLPVLEALHCGCPVIAADRTAIPEVADGHALLLEPSIGAFADAFRNPPAVRPSLPHRWTWEETARKTADVLKSSL